MLAEPVRSRYFASAKSVQGLEVVRVAPRVPEARVYTLFPRPAMISCQSTNKLFKHITDITEIIKIDENSIK